MCGTNRNSALFVLLKHLIGVTVVSGYDEDISFRIAYLLDTGKLKVNKKYRKYCRSVKYIKKGKKDPTIKAMQKWLGVKATGNWNKTTAKALQRKIGVKADGYFGKKSMKALQRYLNNNRY